MVKFDDENGVWRTIGGRRVFIREGQSLSDAMKQSGKFKNLNKKTSKKEMTAQEASENQLKRMQEEYKDVADLRDEYEDKVLSKYDKLNNYEIYDKADALARKTKDYELKDKINKKLNSIDRANKRGEGYAEKQTNELREILKNQDEKSQSSNSESQVKEKSTGYNYTKEDEKHDAKIDEQLKQKYGKANEKESKANYRDQITNAAKNSTEDNVTLDVETGKAVSFDKGYSVSFQQSSDSYSDEEYHAKVEECRNKCDGKVYAGKYGGDAEASFHTDSLEDAKEIMYKYNQESIYDWQHETLIMNDKYDASKNQTNYKSDELTSNSGQKKIGENIKVMRYGDDYIVLKNGHNEKEFKNQSDAENYAKTLSNSDYMNDKIRKGAFKNKIKDDLPKKVEIKNQGTSNRKEVSENIQAHILDYYDSPQDFIDQMDNMNAPTKWHAGEQLAKGGSYMIYYDEQREFLDSLKINPKGKNFSDDKVFNTYTSLVGRESAKLYDRLKKNSYKQYLKQHPGSKMSFSEYKDMTKKGGR